MRARACTGLARVGVHRPVFAVRTVCPAALAGGVHACAARPEEAHACIAQDCCGVQRRVRARADRADRPQEALVAAPPPSRHYGQH